jgi:hypothetical protein
MNVNNQLQITKRYVAVQTIKLAKFYVNVYIKAGARLNNI